MIATIIYYFQLLSTIDKILIYTKSYCTAYELYENDRDFDATMMNFILIGDHVGKLSEELISRTQTINWQKIYGLRNIIAHHYFGINVDIVWQIISNDLPKLKQDITLLVKRD